MEREGEIWNGDVRTAVCVASGEDTRARSEGYILMARVGGHHLPRLWQKYKG